MRKVVGSSSPHIEVSSASTTWNWSWNTDETDKIGPRQNTGENQLSSDNEESEKNGNFGDEDVGAQANGWHSDNEMSSEVHPPQAINSAEEPGNLDQDKSHDLVVEAKAGKDASSTNFTMVPVNFEDPVGVPPEWAPPNVTVPILNLVDKVFQLNRRGWLRRQVFWISKQILQLVMEDAIDDWLLGQINWLRREDTVAQGIQWLQDILWPGGAFFLRVGTSQTGIGGRIDQKKPTQMTSESGESRMTKSESGSFEKQLEAARRASDIKKFLFDGAPATLGSLIGHKQYRRCARDIYYFSQSTICVKQLTYAILELLLVSIFPEMRNIVLDIHQQLHVHQPV